MGVNSAIKSVSTCPLIKLLGLYWISNDPSLVSHLVIFPIKSDLLSRDYRGTQLTYTHCMLGNNGAIS